jgi:hypothetical protein
MSLESYLYEEKIDKVLARCNELATALIGICNAYYNADYDLCYLRIEDAENVLEKYEEDDAND